jgi:hypothetical protein
MVSDTISDIQSVVQISTNVSEGCKHCYHPIGSEHFAESINHYITEHGYRVLHVGQQTEHAPEGPWHSMVAVLGTTVSADELSSPPPAKVTIG